MSTQQPTLPRATLCNHEADHEKDGYVFTNGYTMKREYGVTPNGNPSGGRWVVRDEKGNFIDISSYRHDLAEKYNFELPYIR